MNGVIKKGIHMGILVENELGNLPTARVDPSNTIQADRYIENLVDEVTRLNILLEIYRLETVDSPLQKENEQLKDKLARFENAIRQYQYDIEQVNKRLTGYFQILAEP